MENGQLHDDKLFRAVHDRLSDYEAPSEGADWDAMSRSLNSLPKSARYRWKISLNTILILLGVVGVSALSFALATKSGKNPGSESNKVITVTQPHTNPVKQVNNPQPAAAQENSFATSNELGFTATNTVVTTQPDQNVVAKNDVQSTNTTTTADGSAKKRRNKNQLLFGDQIDPKKGFIYNTKENTNVITKPVDPAPNVFYDTENGQVKKIEINTKSHSKSDSTATIFTPGAPTEGGQTGFDMEN